MNKWIPLSLLLGLILDYMFGDPVWLYHPVRIIGNCIAFLEKSIRKVFPKTRKGELLGGCVLVLLICIGSGLVPWILLTLAFRIHVVFGVVLETFLCYQMLAVKSLKTESMKVYKKLKKSDLKGARKAVSMIVGRDTENLDMTGVTKATVETIAENTSDGIIAPMFYMALGGPVLMFLYKGINTMDSMVGYKNDTYLYFGRCAARLDDVANYIPARLSGWIMILSSAFAGLDWKNGKKIFLRDRLNHASPNSAQTEAVMAGVLDVQLAGNACYFGKVYEKPTIGDDLRPIECQDIIRANRLLYLSAVVSALIFGSIRMILAMIFTVGI